MRKFLTLAAIAALAGWSATAAAQTTTSKGGSDQPPAAEGAPQAPAPPAASTGATANTAAGAPDLAVGVMVKDNTGAAIGQVTDLKTDTDGKRVATIRMGADVFSVEADRLAVQNGAAIINASQDQLKSMIKKK